MSKPFAKIEDAIKAIRRGEMIILVDDESRENEGDLIVAAEKITPEIINFMATHARGLICLPMKGEDLDRLEIPMMAQRNRSKYQTAFTVSIEAASGVTTGISAFDRAATIKTAIAAESTPDDIVMPGHMFPLRAQDNGVLEREGHTEGVVDLVRLAGLHPAGVLCEIVNADGTMARLPELQIFAEKHNLLIANIADLIEYRKQHDIKIIEGSPSTVVQTV